MKTPLRYQITEFDCGSVSLLNCITYLFDREEIPAELVKAISTYTLDCYDAHGNLGQKGTSREAVKYISRWISDFSNKKDFGIKCKYLAGEEVTIDKIKKCLKSGGCVNLRTYQTIEHYVMVTGIDDNYVYIWDPYFREINDYKSNKNISATLDFPTKYNRIVKIDHFLLNKKTEFSLGPVNKREVVLFNKVCKK